MQLSVVRKLILEGCSDDITASGLLVIDAVGWRSMYFVVMPRVNLIVILMTYACYLYSINWPTVICLPSMSLFILWRDTTIELWIPVQFPLHCYYYLLLLTLFTFLHTTIDSTRYAQSFVYSKPVRLTTSSEFGSKVLGCVVSRFHVAASWRRANKYRKWRPCWSVTKLSSITFWSLAFSYWIR
jgi:hypothetical protein